MVSTTTRNSVGSSNSSNNTGIEVSAGVRKMIELIKEIVGDRNHSDSDIHTALKDSGMEPNQAAQILLNQDPFRVVKRKRDKKKKENNAYTDSTDSKKPPEKPSQVTKPRMFSELSSRRVGVYTRKALPGARGGREFRVVRDNRISQNTTKELKSDPPHAATSAVQKVAPIMSHKGSSTGPPNNLKPFSGINLSQGQNGSSSPRPRQAWGADRRATDRKNWREGKGTADRNAVTHVQAAKPEISEIPAATMASNSSAVGVYSSSSDPIHVPSPESRKSSAIRTIKREVGIVGGRRQSISNSKPSIASSYRENPLVSSAESFQSFSGITKTEQIHQSTVTETVVPTMQANKPYQNNQYSSKPHHQSLGHQKASQPNKEWRPKSSHKSSSTSPGIIGSPAKSTALLSNNPNEVEFEAAKMQDKLSQINIYENQNVVIPNHIRVPETDRLCLTFGSFGTNFDSSTASISGTQTVRTDRTIGESTTSLSVPVPEPEPKPCEPEPEPEPEPKPCEPEPEPCEPEPSEPSARKFGESQSDQVKNSTSDSPVSDIAHEHHLPQKKELPSPHNVEHYSEIGLVQENTLSVAPSVSHQQHDHHELSNFTAYDSQAGYDIPYMRQTADASVRGQELQPPQEPISSLNTISIPASTMMQQQAPLAQMYPQLHVPHFANVMPYRQFLSPVYVPPMAMPGYSTNPAFPHPSSGSSYVLMAGSSSHIGGSGLKYGMQQYKPVPTGNPAGFGNFVNPSGYAVNAPGVVSSGATLEDSSRIKYKDGKIYIPSPQAETSEVWMQNQLREFPGLQSTPYYNMPGQTPHAAYLQSHNGHASFNAAAAQSSHMQFPGVYHTPQPAGMPNPHHLGPVMSSNVQVGVAPAAPVGAYQQQQPGLSWTTSF